MVSLGPNGRYFSVGLNDGGVAIHRVPHIPAVGSEPEWLASFAEAMGGCRLGEDDRLESLEWEERLAVLNEIRVMTVDDPLLKWAQSVLGGGESIATR